MVHLILKKPTFYPTLLDNFHTISNLPLWVKMIDKVVSEDLGKMDYLDSFYLRFRPRNGLELVAFSHDLWLRENGGYASIFALLDLSDIFNTINHGILLD